MSPTQSALIVLSLFGVSAFAQTPRYAPTPPPIVYNNAKPRASNESAPIAQTAAQYSIGDPTDEEQMHLELINRSRADANKEALRLIALSQTDPDVAAGFDNDFWTVDIEMMKAQFATNPPVPPVGMNAKLTAAARGHSQWMLDNAIQDHTGANGSTPVTRVQAAGYQFSTIGENIFLNAQSVQDGHAAFDVDWGFGPGGMQSPPGHRNTIHNGAFFEVGIGVIKGTHTNDSTGKMGGPQVVTEDFAAPLAGTRFITGVAYYDINGNNFYDLGEGLPGVRVTVDGVSSFAITTTSGGYSVPIPPNTSRTLRFNATGYPELASTVGPSPNNIKVDFKPAYVVPLATGPATAYTGIDNVYNIPPLPGATGYRARVTPVVPVPPEGAEGALDRLTITTFGGYPYISTARKATGAKSFHLGHMVDNGFLDPQIVEFNDRIEVLPNARVDFQSLLGAAGNAQIARFEVSDDNGDTWTTLWSQNGGTEETQFSAKSVSLAQYAGKTILVRFNFDFLGGSAVVLPPSSDSNFNRTGWYFDDITFVNARSRQAAIESHILETPQFVFGPNATGTYLLEFQPIVGTRTFEYGPAKEVVVQANPPVVSLSKNITPTPTTISMEFTLTSGSATTFTVESASSVNGPWAVETGATVTSNQGVFTVTVARTGDARFYRVLAN